MVKKILLSSQIFTKLRFIVFGLLTLYKTDYL